MPGVAGRAGTEGLTDCFGALFVVSRSIVEYVDIFKMVDNYTCRFSLQYVFTWDLRVSWLWVGESGRIVCAVGLSGLLGPSESTEKVGV